ncbi:hypothetical protein [Micromonospora aurantiaca (nom. illeg.)]|nr:hypothetical protein [Micromonospora aurantiaca]
MQITADGALLRSLPNPLTSAEVARIRDARPAGPPPTVKRCTTQVNIG